MSLDTKQASLNSPFQQNLSGPHAFYNQLNYQTITDQELSIDNCLPITTYKWETKNKITRIAKQILSIIVFPISIYQVIHALAGKLIIPASFLSYTEDSKILKDRMKLLIQRDNEWKIKRITIEVDERKVDAIIIGKASTFDNGRWILVSQGNAEFYEEIMEQTSELELFSEINANAIVFNYPGVRASTGWPNKQALIKAYQAVLTFLEDKEKGVGAKEIIGYGHSIGGGVQGQALETHGLKEDIKYVFVKSRTFSSLQIEVSQLIHTSAGFLIKILGWDISSIRSSIDLKSPEIILQTARVGDCEELADDSKVKDDGIILAEAPLAKTLLKRKSEWKHRKTILGIEEDHNQPLSSSTNKLLAEKIKAALS